MNELGYWNEIYNCIRKSWINELDSETVVRFRKIPYTERLYAYKKIDKIIFDRFVETLRDKRNDGTLNNIPQSASKFVLSSDVKPNRVFQIIHEESVSFMHDLNIDQLLAPYEIVQNRGNQ